MTDTPKRVSRPVWRRELHGIYVIAKKDAMIYYLKPPVFIFGVLFPVFFFLAFTMGREVVSSELVPGMVAMALFFTASAVGPLVTPWERRSRTYERLVSSPVSQLSIILGDVAAGALFGGLLSVVPIVIGVVFTDAAPVGVSLLLPGILLAAVSFAALGSLLAAPRTDNPSQVMMLSNLVRLPLIFISGVFVPLAEMPVWSKPILPLSPLSYATDIIRAAYGAESYFGVWLDLVMLVVFAVLLVGAALFFHRRGRGRAA